MCMVISFRPISQKKHNKHLSHEKTEKETQLFKYSIIFIIKIDDF